MLKPINSLVSKFMHAFRVDLFEENSLAESTYSSG